MLHARKDYNRRIQDCDVVIPAQEPVFMLRGQDVHAPLMLDIYAHLVAQSLEVDLDIVRNTREQAKAMRAWQEEHVCKSPDMKPEDSVF